MTLSCKTKLKTRKNKPNKIPESLAFVVNFRYFNVNIIKIIYKILCTLTI